MGASLRARHRPVMERRAPALLDYWLSGRLSLAQERVDGARILHFSHFTAGLQNLEALHGQRPAFMLSCTRTGWKRNAGAELDNSEYSRRAVVWRGNLRA